jgi:hypothetical protein
MENEKASLSGALSQKYDTIPDGSLSTVFSGEVDIIRWGTAVQAGVIRLMGKVQATREGVCRICFAPTVPPDGLEDAITAACKQAYDRTLERVHTGEEWLLRNRDGPDLERGLAAYDKLLERLRLLWLAIEGE